MPGKGYDADGNPSGTTRMGRATPREEAAAQRAQEEADKSQVLEVEEDTGE